MAAPSEDELAAFVRWRDAIGIQLKCPACGSTDWTLSRPLGITVLDEAGQPTNAMAPFRPVMCQGCGLIHLFAAVPRNPAVPPAAES